MPSMDENENLEFQWFERIQKALIKAFERDGYEHLEAQELGFFIAQGIRDVPPLLRLLDEADKHQNCEIIDAVYMVLTNHGALYETAKILLHED